MRVKATARGYYGQLREPGDVFDIESEDDMGSWMEVEGKRGRKAKADDEPTEQQQILTEQEQQ